MAKETDKERLDRAHEMGVRDGRAGSPKDPPHHALMETIFGQVSDRDEKENDAYRRGYEGGKNQRK
jgi:ribosome modulation factor